MKKTLLLVLSLLFTFSASAQDSLDDAMSEKLSPLLSNYLGDYGVSIQAEHVFFLAVGQPQTQTIPVLLLPAQVLKAESLQDCDENASSTVCKLAGAIKQYIQINNVTKGKITLDLKIYQSNKLVKDIKDVEVLSF